MKLHNGGPQSRGGVKRTAAIDPKLSPLPVEWMDPLSWRLPSGKALAEFALRSGFLAPLVMGGSMGGFRGNSAERDAKKASAEVPVSSGRFREAGSPAGKRA